MARDTLLKLKWTNKLHTCKVIFVHRGAPGNLKEIEGRNITELRKGYFVYMSPQGETTIPYHRIRKIKVGFKTIWKRPPKKAIKNLNTRF